MDAVGHLSNKKVWVMCGVWVMISQKTKKKDCYIYDMEPTEENGYKSGRQECAHRFEYWGPYCHLWFTRSVIWVVKIEGVRNIKRATPCTTS